MEKLVFSCRCVRKEFGTSAAVSAALQQLRAAAQAQGLPGVYIVGGFGTPSGTLVLQLLSSAAVAELLSKGNVEARFRIN